MEDSEFITRVWTIATVPWNVSNETYMARNGLQTQTLGTSDDRSRLAIVFKSPAWQ